jgi:hypothetical protein
MIPIYSHRVCLLSLTSSDFESDLDSSIFILRAQDCRRFPPSNTLPCDSDACGVMCWTSEESYAPGLVNPQGRVVVPGELRGVNDRFSHLDEGCFQQNLLLR